MTQDSRSEALRKLLDEGWAYHDQESERLARELEAAAGADVASGMLEPFLHVSSHTIGEHLGDWPRALRVGKRVLDGRAPAIETARGWGRMQVTAVLAGDPIEAQRERIAAAFENCWKFGDRTKRG